jgi:hypothetical protein
MRGIRGWMVYGAMLVLFSGLSAVEDASADLVNADCNDPRSIWLFDEPDFSGHMTCLSRDAGAQIGFDALNWITRYFSKQQGVKHWGGAVRSFWAGSDPGYFRLLDSPFTVERFVAHQRANSVSETVAKAYVLALTEPNATREMSFTGWRFGLATCTSPRVDPGSSFYISGGQEGYIDTQVPVSDSTRRSDGLLNCSYSISWPLRYGVRYDVGMAGGRCHLTVLENSILKESLWWNFVAGIHFYDGTCWPWPPS